MQNVNYTFINNEGNFVFRSNVNSFGLDHVTDKDVTSFYTNFSSSSYFDTGLLPVDGTGLLSIRKAGNHTQIAYQHAPGKYYINWGSYEGDHEARKYYVAQPYRIVVADLLNGNIYGARTYYSPMPITYPQAPLYHVNLPNINCKGYRGNSVGWICLYHNEDISAYPFNEKLVKILDRCSGTETYNDNNMSETDGPCFYRENNKPDYLTNPQYWQDYSDQNGYEWTLDPELWIPILVEGRDNQDKHYSNGQPLTFADAIIGNYQCYYSDNLIPKPVNRIVRSDYSLDSNLVFEWFRNSYNESQQSQQPQPSIDPYSSSLAVKETLSLAAPAFVNQQDEDEDEQEDEDTWYCESCHETFSESNHKPVVVYNSTYTCQDCIDESYSFAVNTQSYHHDDDVLWLSLSEVYIFPDTLTYSLEYKICTICSQGMYYDHKDFNSFMPLTVTHPDTCQTCIHTLTNPSEQPF